MSAILEIASVTKGALVVPTKEDLKRVRLLVPGSGQPLFVDKPRTPTQAPRRLQFGMLRNRRLKMILPIPVELEKRGQTVVARWIEIDEFGYGKNISQAVDDFGKTIEELYVSLDSQREKLSADLEKVWKVLSRHIEPRPRS